MWSKPVIGDGLVPLPWSYYLFVGAAVLAYVALVELIKPLLLGAAQNNKHAHPSGGFAPFPIRYPRAGEAQARIRELQECLQGGGQGACASCPKEASRNDHEVEPAHGVGAPSQRGAICVCAAPPLPSLSKNRGSGHVVVDDPVHLHRRLRRRHGTRRRATRCPAVRRRQRYRRRADMVSKNTGLKSADGVDLAGADGGVEAERVEAICRSKGSRRRGHPWRSCRCRP